MIRLLVTSLSKVDHIKEGMRHSLELFGEDGPNKKDEEEVKAK